MSEIGDLIAILGGISEDPGVRDQGPDGPLARLVPALREPGRRGWYAGLRRVNDVQMPGVDQALANLAIPTTYPSMLPRRVLAVALLAQAYPSLYGPEGEHVRLSLAALSVPGILRGRPPVPAPVVRPPAASPPDRPPPDRPSPESAPPGRPPGDRPPAGEQADQDPSAGDGTSGPDQDRSSGDGAPGPDDTSRAVELLEALADRDRLTSVEGWPAFLVAHAELVSDQLLALPPPCATSVVEPPSTVGAAEVALLRTTLCVRGVDFATVTSRFLDPGTWVDCSPWWQAMAPVTATTDVLVAGGCAPPDMWRQRYFESVSVDVVVPIFDVSVFLDFARPVATDGRWVVTYTMPPVQPVDIPGMTADGTVDVDRGVIEVRDTGDHVHVETSKRIRFTNGVTADIVAVLACWVGYGEAGADLVCDCSGPATRTIACGEPATPGDALGRFVDLAAVCAAEAGEEAQRLADRMGGHDYSVEDASEDATRIAGLALRGVQKVATTWLLAAADLASAAGAPSGSGAETAAGARYSFASALAADCRLRLESLCSPYGERVEGISVASAAADSPEPGLMRAGERDFVLLGADLAPGGTAYVGTVVAESRSESRSLDSVAIDLIAP